MFVGSPTRNEKRGNTGHKVRPVNVLASRTGACPRNPSCFDPLFPRIKDDRDLMAFIAKYHDAFPEDGKFREKANARPLPHEYSKAELSRTFTLKDRDWNNLLDLTRQVVERPTIDVLEPSLFGIPVRILFGSREYNPRYSPDREGTSLVLLNRKIFGIDGRMREVMVIVHPEEALPNSTTSIIDYFSGFVPPLTGVTKSVQHKPHCGPAVATGTSSSSSKELPYLLSDQRATMAVVKQFQTPVDIVKLAEIRSPSLEHQVSYDFTKAMVGISKWLSRFEAHARVVNDLREDLTCARKEIDSLHGQISSLDDAHESTNDDLLKVHIDLQESWEELIHTPFFTPSFS
ncbi:hypothetical protein F0562_029489 [Nyssa sinensis]|uniref:Uncharacterized protein n=1 Tax=Nyssa sinensis TaxID=561372 RepID=A0A5J5B767_9ASTE|nr:hypothetical protein F0562_029489 [Nyssa sinensis]